MCGRAASCCCDSSYSLSVSFMAFDMESCCAYALQCLNVLLTALNCYRGLIILIVVMNDLFNAALCERFPFLTAHSEETTHASHYG